MPTESLTIGPVHTLTEDVIYALPPRAVLLQSDVEVETSLDGVNFAVLAGSTTGVMTAAIFVRCPSDDTLIVLKAQ